MSSLITVASIYVIIFLRVMRQSIKKWKKIKGNIKSLDLIPAEEWHPGNIRINYSYEYEESSYSSNIVGIAHMLPFHLQYYKDDELYESLEREMDQGGKIDIWVNPETPSQSIITDQPWYGQDIVAIFGSISLWLSVYFVGKHYHFFLG